MKHAAVVKGQIILKCLFGVFNFFQKMNENTSHTSKNEFILLFFGRIHDLTICFWINWPLKGYKCVISQLKKLRHKIRSWLILHIKMSSKRNIFCSVFKQTSIYQVCKHIFWLFEPLKYLFTYLPCGPAIMSQWKLSVNPPKTLCGGLRRVG